MRQLGAEDIHAAIGPTISQANYEVGPEFQAHFVARDPANARFFVPSQKSTHFMFDLPILQASATLRAGAGQWFAEIVATFGLVMTIIGCVARTPAAVPYAVGLYITSAYWFTASTSFANPAVTIARTLSDTFAGIAPADAPTPAM